MKSIAVIQARWNSTRFPGKMLAMLAGKTVLQRVVERVRQSKVDQITVATGGENTQAIAGHCIDLVPCAIVTVAEHDVLRRFVLVLADGPSDLAVVRVCGDNPLIVPSWINMLLRAFRPGYDYVGFKHHQRPMILGGTGHVAEVASLGALRRLDAQLPPDDTRREHVTQGFYTQRDKYTCLWLDFPVDGLPNTAIDTPDDLRRVEALITEENWETRYV